MKNIKIKENPNKTFFEEMEKMKDTINVYDKRIIRALNRVAAYDVYYMLCRDNYHLMFINFRVLKKRSKLLVRAFKIARKKYPYLSPYAWSWKHPDNIFVRKSEAK